MTDGPGPAALACGDEAGRRRRIRRSALLFTAVAAGFYFAFIVMALVRGWK